MYFDIASGEFQPRSLRSELYMLLSRDLHMLFHTGYSQLRGRCQ